MILHYSYCFYVTSYSKSNESDLCRAEKLKCLSLLTELLFRENESDIILNILMGIGTLLFRDENVIQFANQDIVNCCNELIQAIQKSDL